MMDPNDLATQFQAHRERFADQTAADELLARIGGDPEASLQTPAAANLANPASDAPEENRLGDFASGRNDPSLIESAVGDVVLGVIETPRSIVKGVRDAYQNTIDLAGELGEWIEDKTNAPVLEVGRKGIQVLSHDEAIGRPRVADLAKLPDLNDPKSTTGGIIKGVSQFLTGFKGMGKLAEVAGLPKAAGTAGYLASTLKGAGASFTAFDGQQKRLANLIEEHPSLSNPVTAYLSARPGDGKAEGRFKNALEGLGLGLVTDGFFKSIKLLRNAAISRSKQGAQAIQEVAAKELSDDIETLITKPTGETKLTIKPSQENARKLATAAANTADISPDDLVGRMISPAEHVTSSAAGRAMEPPKTFINFAHVDSPEDVQKLMQNLADASAPASDSAKAGPRSFDQVKFDAQHEDAWKTLVSRQKGQPLTDTQTYAARQLWASATDKVAQLAQAASENPSEANLFAFRKMLSVHDVIQKEVLGARAATARALNSWRMPAGSGAEKLKQVQAALEQNGGNEVTRLLADRMSALAKSGMIKEMAAVAEKGAGAKTVAAAQEAWINGLLSGPQTHAANIISNTATMGLRMAERATGAKIASLLGDEGSIATNEATAQWFGMVQGAKDMARYYVKSAKALATGAEMPPKPIDATALAQGSKLEYTPAISSEGFGISSDTWLGRAADYGGMLVRAPGAAMQYEDELFKTMGYRMELNAQALRQATKELNQGTLSADSFKARIGELIANPPENIKLASADAALYQTFTNAPGKLAQGLSRMTQQYPALKVLLPFVRTPANILKFTFERTPLAPVMQSFRSDIAAGGARRDLALAQMAVGTSMMLAATDASLNGQITGRGPIEKGQRQALQREGWQPYSVKVGDRWVAYNRLDPVGSLMGLAADASETLQNAQHEALDDPDTEKLAVATAVAFAGNLVNKTYLSGLSSFIAALNEPSISAETWAQRLAGSVVPSAVATAERVTDPTVREAYSMMDAISARTPGLSKDLPARLDLWGEPIKNESGYGKAFDAFSPVYTAKPTPEPIDKEIQRLGSNITMPGRNTSFNGATINFSQYPKAYQRYVELAGNELKHPAWGLGAKDLLNAVVGGEHPLSAVYRLRSDGPDGGKDVFIRDIVRQYRDLAKKQILVEYPDIAEQVNDKRIQQRALKMPVIQ